MKTVLVTGGAGQVGSALRRLDWGGAVRVLAPGRDQLDLGSAAAVRACFAHGGVDAVVNAAAYTAVDRAESEVGEAFAVNALGPALLAEATAQAGIPLIHLSTDYVFAGDKAAPYGEDDPVGPLGVYGASKLAGELAARAGNARSVVLRTAWVLSPFRSNFLKTMRRLAETRPEIAVVADQVGCPTSADDIAAAVRAILIAQLSGGDAPAGVYHFVNAGEASWCELANAIFAFGAGDGPRATARPITTADYPTAARRPANSRLATDKIRRDFGVVPRPWREAVAEIVGELDRAAIHKEPEA
jgi:dTDP-4-dehydrorhamnose reductase